MVVKGLGRSIGRMAFALAGSALGMAALVWWPATAPAAGSALAIVGPAAPEAPRAAIQPQRPQPQRLQLLRSIARVEPSRAGVNSGAAAARPRPGRAYANLPLRFEANRGQTDPRVRFVARGRGYVLFLTPGEVVLRLGGARGAVVRMRFGGANPQPRMVGVAALPGRSHYFLGNDPGTWVTRVPGYARVVYEQIYPGIDMVFYGAAGGALEYDFVLAPGADPENIRLEFEGADRIEVDPDGDLVLHLADGEIRQRRPVVFQEVDGVRQVIPARYALDGNQRVRLEIAAYDRNRPMTIDPVVSYATYLGGSSDDFARAIAVDSSGSVYVTGNTESLDFPTVNPLQGEQAGGGPEDAFIVKLDPSGTSIVYATFLGGSSIDFARGVAVDAAGSAYIVGETRSDDFPVANAFQRNLAGNVDSFIAKLDPTGSALVYSTYLGGSGFDSARGIAVDRFGNVAVMGQTLSVDFPLENARQPVFGGEVDAFVTKLDASGSNLIFSTYHGGSGADLPVDEPQPGPGWGIAMDPEGNVYVCGTTESLNFPIVNALQSTNGGGRDAFVSKFDATGSVLVYSTYIGAIQGDTARGIAVDAAGFAYVTGGTRSDNFPTTPNAFQPVKNEWYDAFVLKLNRAGNQLLYSTFIGGNDPVLGGGQTGEGGNAIVVDSLGNAYVTGQTNAIDFPTVNAVQPTYGGGILDSFLVKLDPTGSTLDYATFIGGSDSETPLNANMGIAVDAFGNVYVAGSTLSTDFPTRDAVQTALGGGFDAFVMKVRTSPQILLQIEEREGENHLDISFGNPGTAPQTVQLKLWIESESLENFLMTIPAPETVVLPPGPLSLKFSLVIPSGLSFPGTVFSGRLVDTVTGTTLDESVCAASPCN